MRILKRFFVLASASLQDVEKRIKSEIINNVLRLDKAPKSNVSCMMDTIKQIIMDQATIACDSDPSVDKAEFTLYIMKFANNPTVKEILKYLERMVAQIIEFDMTIRQRNEKMCPFTSMLCYFQNDTTFVKGAQLDQVR